MMCCLLCAVLMRCAVFTIESIVLTLVLVLAVLILFSTSISSAYTV